MINWPEKIRVREVRIKNNPGVTDDEYSIYTTATGYGYEKHAYYSEEHVVSLCEKIAELEARLEQWKL